MVLDKIKSFFQWLKKQPLWLRLVLICVAAIACAVLTFSSCGPTVKVAARSTSDMVTISVSQNVTDSTGVSVSVNPNININPKN